jgi:hypothetical protein
MAPAVIHIDEVEKLFAKEKKKKEPLLHSMDDEQTASPLRQLRRALLAQVKSMKPNDRILIVGTSKAPHRILFPLFFHIFLFSFTYLQLVESN